MLQILCLSLMLLPPEAEFLPQWMTPAESLRVDDIGKGHVVTSPPGVWVETPGEFENLRGVFISWFYGTSNAIFREIVREVVEVSRIFIIVESGSEQSAISSYLTGNGISLDSVEFYIWPRNSIWIRDFGPWFMRQEDDSEGIVDFQYNRPRPQDDTIPWRIGEAWNIPVFGSPLEHAGGNFMTDGLGTGFSSTLIYQENSGYSHAEIDSLMLAYCGLEQFIVLQRINIEYTGHIDLWTKILNDTLVMVGEYESGHPNHTVLNQHADSIASCVNREGLNYRIVRIPMPWSMSDAPPSYLNSLIVNDKVLVPLYDEPEDDTALFVYQQALPDHEIIGINCASMAGWGGAIHCITMQIPSSYFLHIRHYPLTNTDDTLNPYRVEAHVTTSNTLVAESSLVYYRVNNYPYTSVPLTMESPGLYAGYIPAQHDGDTVQYYIVVQNEDDIRRTSPRHVPVHVYTFAVDASSGINEYAGHPTSSHVVHMTPNPVKEQAVFSMLLTDQTNVKIEIYNIAGQKERTLVDGMLDKGTHRILWDVSSDGQKRLARGVYFYRAVFDGKREFGKIIVIQ
ncbi:MAG: agmatine deiminase family protein [candidate division WOR-3 bacterium]|nr:MAG: agmatine deiminase family protein [candidate division WOR-3 bacterium]